MNRVAVLAALMAAIVGAGLLWLYKQRFEAEASGGGKVEVVVASQDIALGTRLTKDHVALRPIPENYVQSRQIRAENLDQIIGVRVSMALKADEALLWSDLATTTENSRKLAGLVSRGMRAVPIQATLLSTFGGLLRPGDRVDALLTTTKPGLAAGRVTIPLLQNLLVLATGEDVGAYTPGAEKQPAERKTTVTVSATVEQAQILVYAMDRGDITLTLRNYEDIEIRDGLPETTDSDILESQRRRRVQTRAKTGDQGVDIID